MAQTRFSGPVKSDNGFVGNVTGNVTGAVAATTITASGAAELTAADNVLVIPTSDPGVAGAIWYDVDTLKVSTGA